MTNPDSGEVYVWVTFVHDDGELNDFAVSPDVENAKNLARTLLDPMPHEEESREVQEDWWYELQVPDHWGESVVVRKTALQNPEGLLRYE